MRTVADLYKPLQLIVPQAATATVTGSGVAFTPNNDPLVDATAIVNIGATSGAPTSFTVVVTIEQSVTSGGTYTVTDTFVTATAASQNSIRGLKLDPTKGFVRAKATIAFVGGTSPTIAIAVNILVRQNNGSATNATALA